jgi:hypothetical protein
MATPRSRKPEPAGVESETFIVEAAEPLATPFAGLGKAAPSGRPLEGAAPTPFAGLGRAASTGRPVEGAAPTPFAALREAAPLRRAVEGHELALGQMRLAIEEGLLMVFGPDGDPVPPRAFATAAAAQPAILLELPDGTTAPAARIAAVLRAQVLGRLGGTSQGGEWILAMLREVGGPEPASEDELRAEQDASGPLPESDDQAAPRPCGQAAAATAEAAPAAPQGEAAGAGAGLRLDPKAAGGRTEFDLGRPAAPAARGSGGRRPSTSVRDDDGGWFSSLRNLSTLAIARGPSPGSRKGAGAPGARGDLKTRTVSPADRSSDARAGHRGARGRHQGERGPVQEHGAGAANGVAGSPGSRTIALGLNPQALEAEGFHALVVRDVPAHARLSAGAYDPALDGWLMRPRDLGSLTISAPPELRGDFTVTLMGIALRPGDANAVRILAWLPVRFA